MINPKPFLLENHLTVPLILDMVHLDSLSLLDWLERQSKYTSGMCVVEDCDRATDRSSGIEATLCGAAINPTKSIHETSRRSRTGIDYFA